MQPRDASNPANRFHAQTTTYDDGESPPPASVTLIDDHSRSILAENDSPDLSFRYSVNPYRGCVHACAYCLDGATPILLGDGRTRPLAELRAGDEVLGTVLRGRRRHYRRTQILAHWATRKPAFRVALADGTELIASGDHRFLTECGWTYVAPDRAPAQRPHLAPGHALIGVGRFAAPPAETAAYRLGYLCGLLRGDATLRGLVDLEALARARRYLADLDVETDEVSVAAAHDGRRAIRTRRGAVDRLPELVAMPTAPAPDWRKGFLAGSFDAEGSRTAHVLRVSSTDATILATTLDSLAAFGFDAVLDGGRPDRARPIYHVRLRGGLAAHLRFFHLTGAAISRKWDLDGAAVTHGGELRVVRIEPLGERPLFDITTGTGDFVANGVVSHNCYARPSHEYLDLGAGTDFDTKIIVKREAPALLRAAFEKPSWQGEHVMFSGVTDCYQAAERDLQLTRQCLEVCLEYRQPVSVISKSALVERDLDLFVALHERARFSIAVSLAFADADVCRAIEPWTPSPERRLKVIEKLAAAGLRVGVMCAPIIPGVNDRQMVPVLERAAAAGATSAGWVLLRLPGAVKHVFEERVRVALPLAADKILTRIRDTRAGEKLYDSRFGIRGRGEGPYADAIAQMFDATCARLGLNRRDRAAAGAAEPTTFTRPAKPTAQLSLF